MYSLIKIASVLSCGLLLCLGCPKRRTQVKPMRRESSRLAQAKVIKGDLVRIDYGDCLGAAVLHTANRDLD